MLMAFGLDVRAEEFGTGTNRFALEFVEIANVHNAAYERGGERGEVGSVDYVFRMGKHEISARQVALAMAADERVANGNEDEWDESGINAPAARVSWLEAAKFANWLTSESAWDGAYRFDTNGVFVGLDRQGALEAFPVVYVLPNADEWYKAAYYRPEHNGTYTRFASGSDAHPPRGDGGWNYDKGAYTNGYANYMWEVQVGAQEQNGTINMNGNIWEWFETNENGLVPIGGKRKLHGGGAEWIALGMAADFIHVDRPLDFEHELLGFRVAALSLPPPAPTLSIHSGIEITWISVSGTLYQVRYSTNLASDAWTDLGVPVVGNGTTVRVYDETGLTNKRFYRVIVE